MSAYLDAMDAAVFRGVEPAEPAPCVLAALGPKMLQLAARRTRGAHPYFTPPEHTAMAREVMGGGPLLLPEQAFVLETDPGVGACQGARAHDLLPRRSTTTAATCFGSATRRTSSRTAAATGSSTRSSPGATSTPCATGSRRISTPGADHVCVQAVGDDPLGELRRVAPALRGL